MWCFTILRDESRRKVLTSNYRLNTMMMRNECVAISNKKQKIKMSVRGYWDGMATCCTCYISEQQYTYRYLQKAYFYYITR